MKLWKTALVWLLVILLLPAAAFASESAGAPDYGDPASWAYYAMGEDRDVDVFLICPMVTPMRTA